MSKKKDIIKTDIQTPDGIAIDWIHDLLYWTDTGFNSIQVASLEGDKKATIISNDLDEPRGITLDPKNGYVDVFFIPLPTKLPRDIVMLPSFRNILVNTLESTSFNGF